MPDPGASGLSQNPRIRTPLLEQPAGPGLGSFASDAADRPILLSNGYLVDC